MNSYAAVWFNYLAQQNEIIYIKADNLYNAKCTALTYIMLKDSNNSPTFDDIEYIIELNDNVSITLDGQVKEYIRKHGKGPIFPNEENL